MRSASHPLLILFPASLALVLLAFFAVPIQFASVSLSPNVGMVMTVAVGTLYPRAWPSWFAFLFGLVQDSVFATPMGLHALVLLLIRMALPRLGRQGDLHSFHAHWLQVALLFLTLHLSAWCILQMFGIPKETFFHFMISAMMTAAWYPLVYGIVSIMNRLHKVGTQ